MINKHLTLSGSDCGKRACVKKIHDCRTWLSIVMCRAVATGTTRTNTYIYIYIHIHTNTMFSPKKSFRASPCFVLLSQCGMPCLRCAPDVSAPVSWLGCWSWQTSEHSQAGSCALVLPLPCTGTCFCLWVF